MSNTSNQRPPLSSLNKIALFAILALHLFIASSSMQQTSVTIDEYSHLPAAHSYWQTGEFRLDSLNTPLVRWIYGIPLQFQDIAFPMAEGWESKNHWTFAYEYQYANAENYHDIFVSARYVGILFGLGTILLVFWLARRFYGVQGALFASFLTAFSPEIIAHDRLVSIDIGLTFFFLLNVACFIWYLDRPSLGRLLVTGLSLGAVVAAKFSGVWLALMEPLLIVLLVQNPLGKQQGLIGLQKRIVHWIGAVLILAVSAIIIFDACYLFRYVFISLAEYPFAFKSELMIAIKESLLGVISLPLPAEFVIGLDAQMAGSKGYVTFSNGEFLQNQTFWWYYLYSFLLKTPVPLIAIIFLALWKKWERDETVVATLALSFILFISFATQKNIGLRYILPALPLLYLLGGRVFDTFWYKYRPDLGRFFVAFLSLLLVAGVAKAYPHYLSYSNLLIGGDSKGYKNLADSNYDWGQDLIHLKRYLDKEGINEPIYLVYFGGPNPAVYGIDYELLISREQFEKEPRPIAISTNYINGYPFRLFDKNGNVYMPEINQYSWLKEFKPSGRGGPSILIFKKEAVGTKAAGRK